MREICVIFLQKCITRLLVSSVFFSRNGIDNFIYLFIVIIVIIFTAIIVIIFTAIIVITVIIVYKF